MKKAIIIGATSGIGKSLAELLLRKGYQVGVTGRREDLFQTIDVDEKSSMVSKMMDVQSILTLEEKCYELVHELGGLDLLIISAGIGEENGDLDFKIEHNVIKTNVLGFTCIADWAARYFKKQGFGHIVNISSIAGIRGGGGAPSYNASKAFQINYLEGLRINANQSNLPIYFTDVRPGFINTAMAKGEGLFWVAPVQKAAQQIFDGIEQKKNIIYITKRWRLIAYFLKIIPYSILKRI